MQGGASPTESEENGMSSVVFTLLFGMLSGIAGFVDSASFETVLLLGLLGLMHLTVVSARKGDAMPLREDIQK
jgi:hypothetical protein